VGTGDHRARPLAGAAADARSGPATPGPATALSTPLSDAEAEHVWREAERIVGEAADHITAEAASDPDAAADAAWSLSSGAVVGPSPGISRAGAV